MKNKETSLKTGFAQIFSCCPKNLSCPNFGGAAAPLAPPARTPMPCEQAFLFGRVKRVSRERAARSRVLARLASLAKIGDLARRLEEIKEICCSQLNLCDR